MARLMIVGLLFLIVFAACAGDPENSTVANSTEGPVSILHELNTVDELKAEFNLDSGQPRLILILSPT